MGTASDRIVIRSAPVNRARTPEEAIIATGRIPHLHPASLAATPRVVGDNVEMMFYLARRTWKETFISVDELDERLAKDGFGLVIDPMGQAAINEAHPAFADTHPNGTQVKIANGKYCHFLFHSWLGKRLVHVGQDNFHWSWFWWVPVHPLAS